MPKIEFSQCTTEPDMHIIKVYMERKLTSETIAECVELAGKEIAKKLWEENQDKIMAAMDLKGLANLVALYASKKLAEDIKR